MCNKKVCPKVQKDPGHVPLPLKPAVSGHNTKPKEEDDDGKYERGKEASSS